jgi:hypothetical protein
MILLFSEVLSLRSIQRTGIARDVKKGARVTFNHDRSYAFCLFDRHWHPTQRKLYDYNAPVYFCSIQPLYLMTDDRVKFFCKDDKSSATGL